MKLKQALLIASVIALSACASKVRLDDLPPVNADAITSNNTDTSLGLGVRGTGTTETIGAGSNNTTNGLGINRAGTNANVATVQAGNNDSNQPTAGMLAKRSVYFDYDSFSIRDEAKSLLQAHARNLSNNRSSKIALEGHTDERGGGEYNLALGQKRANAVQEALQLLGVSATQMEAVSFGKEKPKALGTNEAGYAENRRVDIQYK